MIGDRFQKVYLVVSNAEAGTRESLPVTVQMEIIDSDDLVQTDLRFSKDDKVCIASEAALDLALARIDDPVRVSAIALVWVDGGYYTPHLPVN